MKRLLVLGVMLSLCFVGVAMADDEVIVNDIGGIDIKLKLSHEDEIIVEEEVVEEDSAVSVKQALFYTWNDLSAKNATVVTVVKGKAIASLPKWANMIIDGMVIDVGAAYEDDTIRDGVVLAGKEFGSLGKYVPWLEFPFKDRLEISLHYAGVYLPNVAEEFDPQACSGIGYLKGTFKFD